MEIPLSRSRWAVAYAAAPRQSVLALAQTLAAHHQIKPLAVTQAGLALLPVKDTVEHETFYLGEIPLSRAHVQITGDNQTVQGGACIMEDDSTLADALAILDGVLAARLTGWEDAAVLLTRGAAVLEMRGRVRKTILTRSRVHFALLNQDDEPQTGASAGKNGSH